MGGLDNVTVKASKGRAETATIVGQGDYKYEDQRKLAKLPDGWSFKEVAWSASTKTTMFIVSIAAEHPVMVFDREGNFCVSWGEGQYPRAHGVHMGPDDSIDLTDDGCYFVVMLA